MTLNQTQAEIYDVIIVGGGIVGCGVFRDLALHGQKCLLLDKGDFSSQTSQRSSKMLHGGIRYLENFEFSLVSEALHEKNLWLKMAPHLTRELEFHLPVYRNSKFPLWMLRLGLFAYDFCSGFNNRPYQILNAQKTLERIPGLKNKGLTGSGVYHDAIVDDHKLALECLYDGLFEQRSEALNYTEVTSIQQKNEWIEVTTKDTLNQTQQEFRAKDIVFATGPFTDQFMHQMNIPWKDVLLPTKGIHLWLKKEALPSKYPMVLETYDRRIVFVIPQRDAILVGTTESATQQDFFNIQATERDVTYLLKNLNEFFPNAALNEKSILSTFAGIRPLVRQEGANMNETSREHALYQPGKNYYVLVGGKYTTFRVMAQDVCGPLLAKRKIPYNPSKTKAPLRVKSLASTFEQTALDADLLKRIISTEKVRTFADLLERRLSIPASSHYSDPQKFDQLFDPIKTLLN